MLTLINLLCQDGLFRVENPSVVIEQRGQEIVEVGLQFNWIIVSD